jgi:hypothetical protein
MLYTRERQYAVAFQIKQISQRTVTFTPLTALNDEIQKLAQPLDAIANVENDCAVGSMFICGFSNLHEKFVQLGYAVEYEFLPVRSEHFDKARMTVHPTRISSELQKQYDEFH